MGNFAAASLVFLSTTNGLKGYSQGQLVSGNDMVLPIKHKVYWELINQQKQTQINKCNIRKNIKELTTVVIVFED